MIKHFYGNVIDIDAEILINASNAQGYMGGILGRFFKLKGVAETIHYAEPSIEKIAKKEFKKRTFQCGDILHTNSGRLPFSKGIIHAVTMKKPGQTSNTGIIKECLNNILAFCKEKNVKSAALPLLGAGTGRVDKDEVIQLYESMLQDSDTLFKIVHYR